MPAEDSPACEGMGCDEEAVESRAAKKPRKSVGASIKAQIAELQKQKKAAVKVEDFAVALRLKAEIEELQFKAENEAKAKAASGPKAKASPSKGTKRAAPEVASPSKKGVAVGKEVVTKPPPIEELCADPFFDNSHAGFLDPKCATVREREALRAIRNHNYEFLARKIVGSAPLFCLRDMVSRQTALHIAIEKADTKGMNLLAREASKLNSRCEAISSGRSSSLGTTSTGEMSVDTLGFATGKVGAARGGREMNNALADQDQMPEPIVDVVARSPLTMDQVSLLLNLDLVNVNAVCRRGKIRWYGQKCGNPFACNMAEMLHPALCSGNLNVVKALLPRFAFFGAGPAHRAAVEGEPLPSLQSRSVTARLRFGDITPVHLAAINPDSSKLGELLKLEPTALSMPTDKQVYPIHCAAACAGAGPLRLLLSDWNADRRQAGQDKRTPLHFAAAAGRAENVQVLMGGSGFGAIGTGILFPKEIRTILARNAKAPAMKIPNEGVCVLSRLLIDLLQRVANVAKQHMVGDGGTPREDTNSGMKSLHEATQEVLKGSLAARILEKSGKLAAGKLGLPRAPSTLAKALADMGEDVLQAMFNQIDKDGNGILERKEIKEVFKSAGLTLSDKQFARVMKDMDTDGNGDVSLEEFGSWMEGGSAHAKSLRRHLLVDAGEMGQAEVAEAEVEVEELLQGVDKLAFDARPLLEKLNCPGIDEPRTRLSAGEYMSAILECTCTKVLEVSANAARSQKKTSIGPDHILNSVKSNEDLQAMYQADSVAMNSLLLQARGKDGAQALHLAAEAGHQAVVAILLACGADPDAPGPDRKTALALAAERGHSGCLKALLKYDAKLEIGDKRKRTALLLAVRAGHTVTASALLHAGANPNAADDSGNTVVHYAAAFGWDYCIDLLHKAGATLSTANAMKLVPITAALRKGHKTVFRKMLELGIDVNFRDGDGSTLLLRCLGNVSRLVHEEVKFMLLKGADPSLSSSVDGTTALHAVARANTVYGKHNGDAYVPHPFEVERLRKITGWLPRPRDKNEDPADGQDASCHKDQAQEPAAKKAKTSESEELDEKIYRRGFHQLTIPQREAVFQLGFSKDTWQKGENPLFPWSTLSDKRLEAARVLGLDESAWPNMPVRVVRLDESHGGTLRNYEAMAMSAAEDGMVYVQRDFGVREPLHISYVLLPHEDMDEVWRETPHVTVGIARMLIEKKAVVDARDARGATPLMLALKAGNFDLALLLLDAGADPNAQENSPKLTLEQQKMPQPRPRTPLLSAGQGVYEGFKKGIHSPKEVVLKLLEKGCKVDAPPTKVDDSPMILFAKSGQFAIAELLLDAKADPGVDKSGQNILHVLHSSMFTFPLWNDDSSTSMRYPLALAMKLLMSREWGVKLMSEYTRTQPHVTPLHSLVESFSTSFARRQQGAPVSQWQKKCKVLHNILQAIPGVADLSAWSKPPEEQHHDKSQVTPGAPTKPLVFAQSPLSLLCVGELFSSCPDMGIAVIKLLCERGVSPNASQGSPAALHSLVERLGTGLSKSFLAKELLPLTDLTSRLPNGDTLLTSVLMTKGAGGAQRRETIQLLLQFKCDPDMSSEPTDKTKRPCRPLHLAAQQRDEGVVLDLLAARADANAIDNPTTRRVPLHFAACAVATGATANFDIEEVLLHAKADPNIADAKGWTALHYAFLKEENGALSFEGPWHGLKAQDQSQMQQKQMKQTGEKDEELLLRFWTPAAIQLLQNRVDPIETVSGFCALPGVVVTSRDKWGMTPLHLAALRGSSIAALKLTNARANLEEQLHGNTPLGFAMHFHPDTAVLLMQRSANTQCTCVWFDGMQTSSMVCTGKPESMFSLALRRLSNPTNDNMASSYLGAAVAALDSGFPPSQALDDTISSKQFVMLVTLIPKVGDDMLRKYRFDGGQNVLHRLAASTYRDVDKATFLRAAGKLIERGVPIEIDDAGRTPLHLAALNKHLDLVKLMLSKGVVSKEMLHVTDSKGISAIGYALLSGQDPNVNMAPLHDSALPIAKELICHGVSARRALVHAEAGLSALGYCLATGQPSVVWSAPGCGRNESWREVLFPQETPDLDAVDNEGRSCLSIAAASEHRGNDSQPEHGKRYLNLILKWAKQAGGDIGHKLVLGKDKKGFTPLMHAIRQGKITFVDELLNAAHKMSPALLREALTAQADDGNTPLMLAVASSDCVGMVSVILRWTDDAAASGMLGAVDRQGRTALMQAVLRNSSPLVKMLIVGRPLRPTLSTTTCPAGKLAGQNASAKAVYRGSKSGEPSFGIRWMVVQTGSISNEVVVVEQDGWYGVSVHEGKGETTLVKATLDNYSKVKLLARDGDWVEAETQLGRGFIEARHVRLVQNGNLLDASSGMGGFKVDVEIPAGVGPGLKFDIAWNAAAGGPGIPGLAGDFADGSGASRASASLRAKDKQGWTAMHLCVSPIPFGSYENTEMLSMLVRGGVPAAERTDDGRTAADLASKQHSGRMAKCLKDSGVAVSSAVGVEASNAQPWPEVVDVNADAVKALAAAEAKRQKVEGKREPPVDKHFTKPSASSRVVVARGAEDGLPLDLIMTKVDLTRPFCPLNMFYRMQVLHELNQDNYLLFTRWGKIGESGQFQCSPFDSLEKAAMEFCKIFKSKAGNDWASRADFEKKPRKYRLHEIKYEPTVAAKDALNVAKWVRLPSKISPLQIRCLLNAASSHTLLVEALQKTDVQQPLGNLKMRSVHEAKAMLDKIVILLHEQDKERCKPEPSGEAYQAIVDEIADLSSRIFEIVPVKNFDLTVVTPINSTHKVTQWMRRLDETNDITCAAALLLGAQARLKILSPTDYLYRALGCRIVPLKSDSEELHLIERYVNRSAKGECMLFSGPGAAELPKNVLQSFGDKLHDLPQWQAVQDTVCYSHQDCTTASHAGKAIVAGCLVREFAEENGAICISPLPSTTTTTTTKIAPERLWVRPVGLDGTQALVPLTKREAASRIAGVYRVDRPGEEGRAGGDSATLFFHGSRMPNFLSILSQGLRMKPPQAVHHGSAFGDGIYFANSYMKSRSYCSLSNGVGYMLLCEVSPGRAIKCQHFGMDRSLLQAHGEVARQRLGLPLDAKVSEHPELEVAEKSIRQAISLGEIVNFEGTSYDSLHFISSAAPDTSGNVIHPDGYCVPCGEVVDRAKGTPATGARDEIVVYDASRTRLRYILELRDQNTFDQFVIVAKPGDKEKDDDSEDDPCGGDDEGRSPGKGEDDDDDDSMEKADDNSGDDNEDKDEEEDQ